MQRTLEDTLTPEDVAEALKISTYTVRRLLKERKLRGMKIAGGRYWRIRRSDFEEYLSRQSSPPAGLSQAMEASALSEAALSKEWLTSDEDDYWAHL